MHKVHITDALVLRKRGVGEANTLVWLLTPKLGLVRASARSTRVPQSKLRYGLELLTLGRYSLVQGRHEWRLTGAEAHSRLAPPLVQRRAIGRVTQLVLRLVHGEEPQPALYAAVAEGLPLLAAARPEQVEALECVLVLRILFTLGYLPHTEALSQFVEGDISIDLAAKALASRSLLVRAINESLQATGL